MTRVLGAKGANSVADPMVDVSVIVTVVERPEPLVDLYREYAAVLRDGGWTSEFIFVAHPFYESLIEPLNELDALGEPVRVIESARSVGETALLREGIAASRGRIVLTVPAYRQVQPASVCALIEAVERGVDLAVARRWPRTDSLVNRAQNRLLHLTAGRLAGDRLHDIACGVRAARREVLQEIPLYGDFARFLPLLAMYGGYDVQEIASPQHRTDLRPRVYRPGVYVRRAIDVLGLFFLLRFTEKPLRFFGLVGSVMSGIGAAILFVLLVQKLLGGGISDRPMLLLGVLLLTIGVQSIALGLVGEMIVHFNAARRRGYRLREQRPVAESAGAESRARETSDRYPATAGS